MYSGVVRKVNANPWQGKTLYSFKIGNEDGYFNTGPVHPGIVEGDAITFNAKLSKREGNFDVDVKSIVKTTESQVTPEQYAMTKQPVGGARRAAQPMTKDNYWENREANDRNVQKVIQIQAARNAAIAVLAATTNHGGVDDNEAFINQWTDAFLANNEARLA